MEIPLVRFRGISFDHILPNHGDPTGKDDTLFAGGKKSFFNWEGRSFFSRDRFKFDRRNWRHPFFRIECYAIEQQVETRSVSKSFSGPGLCHQIEKLVSYGKYEAALESFELLSSLRKPEVGRSTYDALVTACIKLESARSAGLLFRFMTGNQLSPDLELMNRILLMQVKCGMVMDAYELFDGMPARNRDSWSTIIAGLVGVGNYQEAWTLFMSMWREFSSSCGSFTFLKSIKACAGLGCILIAEQMHSCAVKLGFASNVRASCSLIDMYGKCGCMGDAWCVFDASPEKTTAMWNSIMTGYAHRGRSGDVLDTYHLMQDSGVEPDQFTFSIVVRACVRLASMSHAKEAHAGVIRRGLVLDAVAGTTLVDFYCKWGRMDEAGHVFETMKQRNVMTWNAMIGGYGNRGRGTEAIAVFDRMLRERVPPDHVTFLALLSACCRSGERERGWEIFRSMDALYGITPRAMHYTCMVDLLGRDGCLNGAYSFIVDSPVEPTVNMWSALLTACRIHGDLELAEFVTEKICALRPEKLCNYVILLNLYRKSGREDDAARVSEMLRQENGAPLPPCTWIEVNRAVTAFHSGDVRSPEAEELLSEIENCGFVAGEAATLLPDVVEPEGRSFKDHGEISAVAFGLVETAPPTPLQLVQEHRLCGDCHGAIMMTSLISRREIIVKDCSRFHHFKDGGCSCGGYW